jgi:hypothetical protein
LRINYSGFTMTTTATISAGSKLKPEQQQKALDEFYREGYAVVPGVLNADEIGLIRELTDHFIDDPKTFGEYVTPILKANVLRSTQALHPAFGDMLVREPFLSLAEAILGTNVGFCGQNVIRSDAATGISVWHVDDIVEFPLPSDIPRHDARIKMPVFWFSFQIALSDIDTLENGATEVVPRTHFSGRNVPGQDGLIFEGRGPVPILCKAGDVYLFNHQLWHRGSVNQSSRRRYLMQNQYCRAWGPYRFASTDAAKRLPANGNAPVNPRLAALLDPIRKQPF